MKKIKIRIGTLSGNNEFAFIGIKVPNEVTKADVHDALLNAHILMELCIEIVCSNNKDRHKDIYEDFDKKDIEFMLECVNSPHDCIDTLLDFVNYKYGWKYKKFKEDFVYQDVAASYYKGVIRCIKSKGYKIVENTDLTSLTKKTIWFDDFNSEKTRFLAIVVEELLGGEEYETTTKGYDIYRCDNLVSYVAIKQQVNKEYKQIGDM